MALHPYFEAVLLRSMFDGQGSGHGVGL
jgi:hypothetical protein